MLNPLSPSSSRLRSSLIIFGGLALWTGMLFVLTMVVFPQVFNPTRTNSLIVIYPESDNSSSDSATQEDPKSTVTRCPWKRADWTLAMCEQWRDKRSITFNGEEITNCGAVSGDRLVTFDSCTDPSDGSEIVLRDTWGKRKTLTMVKGAQTSICRAVGTAKAQGLELRFTSSYRDFAGQVNVFCQAYIQTGRAPSTGAVATPGYSAHGLGIKVDVFLFNQKGEQLTFFRDRFHQLNKPENLQKLRDIMGAAGFTAEIPSEEHCFTLQFQSPPSPASECSSGYCPPPPACERRGDTIFCRAN